MLLAMSTMLPGCGNETSTRPDSSPSVESGSEVPEGVAQGESRLAKDEFTRLLERYASQQHYQSREAIHFQYSTPTGQVSDITRLEVRVSRPQIQLDIEPNESRVRLLHSQGSTWARLEDPLTDDFRHQVVRRNSPGVPSLEPFYKVTEFLDPALPQQAFNLLMGLPIGLEFSPLGFLLGEDALPKLISSAHSIEAKSAQTIRLTNGTSFQGRQLMAQTEAGPFVVSLDHAGMIRRIDFPTGNLFSHLREAERPRIQLLTLEVESCSFDVVDQLPTDESWKFGADTNFVEYFVLPPVPLPSKRLGEVIEPMVLRSLVRGDTAKRFSTASLKGRSAVLLWFDGNAASQETLQRLAEVVPEWNKGRDSVRFLGVNVDSPEVTSDAELMQLQRRLDIPIVRDINAAGRDTIEISEAPTLVVLDASQRLQAYEVGANPQLSQTLPELLEQLAAGQDMATSLRHAAKMQEERFQQQLGAARQAPATSVPAVSDIPLPSAQKPSRARIVKAWQVDDVEQPGNLVLQQLSNTASTNEARLLVLSALRRVVPIETATGLAGAPIDLGLAEDELITQLRPSLSPEEAPTTLEYVGFSQAGQFAYRFDKQLRKISRYAASKQHHRAITDAQLVDLEKDGQFELYLSFAPPLGCQRIEANGVRSWNYRNAGGGSSIVARLDVSPAHLLLTNDAGMVVPLSSKGVAGTPLDLGKRTVHQLVTNARRPSQLIGLAYTVQGRLIAVGFDQAMQELWSYGLPSGLFRYQVSSPQWVQLTESETGHWLIAGPDGSVHIVQADGRFFDSFRVGEQISGIAGHRLTNGKARLYVATERTVTAYDYYQP